MRINGNIDQQAALFAALAQAQGEFPPIERNKTVRVRLKSGGEYTFDYADLDQVLSKTRAALSRAGLAFVQTLGERTEKEIGEEKPITVGTLTTVLAHKNGAYIEDEQTFSLAGTNQEMGAEITYKRRYAAQSILGLAAEQDNDGGVSRDMGAKETSDRPTRRAPAPDPIHPHDASEAEVDVILKFKESKTLTELTAAFNRLPADQRRPGTKLFDAFQGRRKDLMPAGEAA